MFSNRLVRFGVVMVAAVVLCLPATRGQNSSSAVNGVVTDSNGAVIPEQRSA